MHTRGAVESGVVACAETGDRKMSAGHEQAGGVEGTRELDAVIAPEVTRPAVAAHHAAVAAPAPAPVSTATPGRGSFLVPLHRGGFPPQKRRHFLAGQIAGAGWRPSAAGCGCGGGEGLAAGRRRRTDVAHGLDRQPYTGSTQERDVVSWYHGQATAKAEEGGGRLRTGEPPREGPTGGHAKGAVWVWAYRGTP